MIQSTQRITAMRAELTVCAAFACKQLLHDPIAGGDLSSQVKLVAHHDAAFCDREFEGLHQALCINGIAQVGGDRRAVANRVSQAVKQRGNDRYASAVMGTPFYIEGCV